MGSSISIGDLADAVMDGLEDYAKITCDGMKKAVKKAGNTVVKKIKETAPERTGDYAYSWSVKKVEETSTSLHLSVHSKDRYQIAHLLEFGHAKRNGGRVAARPHLANAEAAGIKQLAEGIEEEIRNG